MGSHLSKAAELRGGGRARNPAQGSSLTCRKFTIARGSQLWQPHTTDRPSHVAPDLGHWMHQANPLCGSVSQMNSGHRVKPWTKKNSDSLKHTPRTCKNGARMPLRVELCPPKIWSEVWTPRNCECDLIQKWSLRRCNQVKMRSLRWVLIPFDWCLHKRRRDTETDTQREDDVDTQREKPRENRGETRVTCLQAQGRQGWLTAARSCKRQEVSSLQISERARPCWHLDPGFGLQNSERINFRHATVVFSYGSLKLIEVVNSFLQQHRAHLCSGDFRLLNSSRAAPNTSGVWKYPANMK